jgi:glycosyltransferase involved in cell wall biosynthesis
MVDGLRAEGWAVEVHELNGVFPDPDDGTARASLEAALAAPRPGALVVVDGLAGGAHPDVLEDASARLALVALVHHPLAEETGLSDDHRDRLRALERRALEACPAAVVTSDFTAERLTAYGVARGRIRVVPPGTDPAPRARGPGPDAPPVLLCVASVTPRKGHDVLVDALAGIADLPWRCVCAGSLERDPRFAHAVTQAVVDSGLADRIRFSGELDEGALHALYDAASLFVLPSHYEGYGMALTEALARGLPVVSTTGGAIPHTVPSDAGELVPPGDADALAQVLRDLLTTPDRRLGLADAARKRAETLPDWNEAARAFARALLAIQSP